MQIVRDAGDFLGRAVTIATRYTAVRRQTTPTPGEKELQILDYDNVQQTLLPLLAKTYALKFTVDNSPGSDPRVHATVPGVVLPKMITV
jgi:acyl-CoA oxidase